MAKSPVPAPAMGRIGPGGLRQGWWFLFETGRFVSEPSSGAQSGNGRLRTQGRWPASPQAPVDDSDDLFSCDPYAGHRQGFARQSFQDIRP